MHPERVQQTLRYVQQVYRNILTPESKGVLDDAIEFVASSYERARRATNPDEKTWGYILSRERPLRFVASQTKRVPLHVDVSCEVLWKEKDVKDQNDDIPWKQAIVVRAWCHHTDTIWNEMRDATHVREQLNDPDRTYKGRVVGRFHIDRHIHVTGTTSAEYHPEYHLQIGGSAQDYELWMLPHNIEVPRFPHQPMEIFLTCQMIAANFFWKTYQEIARKNEWLQELQLYQNCVLKHYYETCLDLIESNESLLDGLGIK